MLSVTYTTFSWAGLLAGALALPSSLDGRATGNAYTLPVGYSALADNDLYPIVSHLWYLLLATMLTQIGQFDVRWTNAARTSRYWLRRSSHRERPVQRR